MALNAQGLLSPPTRIVVVDDVVTRGATLIGACSRIADAFPDANLKAFAAVRTMTGAEIKELVEPVAGEITLELSGDTFRVP